MSEMNHVETLLEQFYDREKTYQGEGMYECGLSEILELIRNEEQYSSLRETLIRQYHHIISDSVRCCKIANEYLQILYLTGELTNAYSFHPFKITLTDSQTLHSRRMEQILIENLFALDGSPTGTGKSFIIMYLFLRFGWKHILIICPVGIKETWISLCHLYGLPLNYEHFISYDTLRGTYYTSTKHKLLKRNGDLFTTTPYCDQLFEEGCFLVCDEAHRLKNNTSIWSATKCLFDKLISKETYSRAYLASATFFETETHIINIMRLMGIIKAEKLYSVSRYGKMEIANCGLSQIIDVAEKIDRGLTRHIISKFPISKKTAPTLAQKLYSGVIQSKYCSSMPKPDYGFEEDCYSGYYHLSPYRQRRLSMAISGLQRETGYDSETGRLIESVPWSRVQTALILGEYEKCEIFVRLAISALESNPTNKVIIFMNLLIPIRCVADALSSYNPLVITGSVPPSEREKIYSKFQQPDTQYRLLLAITSTMAYGVNLQDTHGNYRRHVFISPDCYAGRSMQAVGRVIRHGMKSNPIIRFIFGYCGQEERIIIDSLSRKGKIMKETNEAQVESGVIFPGDYPVYYEPAPEHELPSLIVADNKYEQIIF